MGNLSIKKATLINASAKYSTTILNLFFSAVLARLLTPEDFGVVAVASVFTSFFAIIADLGLGSAVIQNKDLTEDDVNNIYSFTFRLAFILSIVFAVFSIPMAKFYENSVYIPIGLLLAVSLIFSTINMIPNAILLKEKRFVLIGIRTFIIALVSSIFAIVLAVWGLKYYAIVLQSVFVSVVTFVWNYASTRPKFTLIYDKSSIQKVRTFSIYQFGFSIINYFARNLDNLLTSKFLGTAALGYYDKAYKLMLYPVQMLTHVITPVLHPILSEYQHDKVYIYKKYMKIVKLLSLLGIFISAICFLAADEIILIMFGEGWSEAIPSFRILALSVWAQMVTSSTGAIFQSLGNTKIMFQAGTISAVITSICIIYGLLLGELIYLSILVAIGFNVSFIINFLFLIIRGFKFSFLSFIKSFIPDILIAISMVLAITFYELNVENVFLALLLKVFVLSFVYGISLIITKQYKIFITLFAKW